MEHLPLLEARSAQLGHEWADSYLPAFAVALAGLGFDTVKLDGSRQIDEASFWSEIKRAFSMPNYFSSGWAAFDDCWRDDRPELIRLSYACQAIGRTQMRYSGAAGPALPGRLARLVLSSTAK